MGRATRQAKVCDFERIVLVSNRDRSTLEEVAIPQVLTE